MNKEIQENLERVVENYKKTISSIKDYNHTQTRLNDIICAVSNLESSSSGLLMAIEKLPLCKQ